jgi:hypothetical protein
MFCLLIALSWVWFGHVWPEISTLDLGEEALPNAIPESATGMIASYVKLQRQRSTKKMWRCSWCNMIHNMAMGQYLLIPFLVGWTSIYQLFWCSLGVQGFWLIPMWFTIWWRTQLYSISQPQGRWKTRIQLKQVNYVSIFFWGVI